MTQGNTDTSFQFQTWPWVDTIGYNNAGTYGIARCGSKTYQITDSNNNVVDWVTIMPDGTLKIQPNLTTAPGTQALTLTVTMNDYTDANGQPITESTGFFVNVNQCTAVINTDSSPINNLVYHRWGSGQSSIRNFFPFTASNRHEHHTLRFENGMKRTK